MDKDRPKKMKTKRYPTRRRAQEADCSTTTPQVAVPAKEGRTKKAARKSRPVQKTPVKPHIPKTDSSEEDLRLRVLNGRYKGSGEGTASPKNMKAFDISQEDLDSASCSTDTGIQGDVSKKAVKRKTPTDGEGPSPKRKNSDPDCNQKEGDVSKEAVKRKTPTDGEGPSRKKKNSDPDQKETTQEPKPNQKEGDVSQQADERKTPIDGEGNSTTRKDTDTNWTEPKTNQKEGDVSKKAVKRKTPADGAGPSRKRKNSDPDWEEPKPNQKEKAVKRKAPTDGAGPSRKKKNSDPDWEEPKPDQEEGHVSKKAVKRKAPTDGKGPRRKRKNSPDQTETKEEPKEGDRGKRAVKRKHATDGEGPSRKRKPTKEPKADQKVRFSFKYKQLKELGQGGCGSVFEGYRKSDNLQVAIKRINKDKVFCTEKDEYGNEVSVEVAVMLRLASEATGPLGTSPHIALLDWYDLDTELILVLERPIPATDLFNYIANKGGSIPEYEAKIVLKQLVDAVKDLEDKTIFHRDIKIENILIETGSEIPRVRLIDFGLSCFSKKSTGYRIFYGTSAHIPPEWYSRCLYRAGPTTVWQLGVVLYEALHKIQPFETKMFLGKKLKVSSELSEDCLDFLNMCLTKVPEKRPSLALLQSHPWIR